MSENTIILESLMKINRSLGSMEEKIDTAIELHRNCPARLGYDGLKDATAKFRMKKPDLDGNRSLIPIDAKPRIPKTTIIWVLSIIIALMFGIAFTGYVFGRSGSPPPKPISPISAVAKP
jgi:hypothetical protein